MSVIKVHVAMNINGAYVNPGDELDVDDELAVSLSGLGRCEVITATPKAKKAAPKTATALNTDEG